MSIKASVKLILPNKISNDFKEFLVGSLAFPCAFIISSDEMELMLLGNRMLPGRVPEPKVEAVLAVTNFKSMSVKFAIWDCREENQEVEFDLRPSEDENQISLAEIGRSGLTHSSLILSRKKFAVSGRTVLNKKTSPTITQLCINRINRAEAGVGIFHRELCPNQSLSSATSDEYWLGWKILLNISSTTLCFLIDVP
ncbi:hypothetical protein Tco_1049387 [Tanacetum coccineum]